MFTIYPIFFRHMFVIVANVEYTVGVITNWPIVTIVITKLSSSYRCWNPSYPFFGLFVVVDNRVVNLIVCQKTEEAGGLVKVVESDWENLGPLVISVII